MLLPAFQSNQDSLCGLCSSRYRGGGGPDGKVVRIKITVDDGRAARRSLMKREKY